MAPAFSRKSEIALQRTVAGILARRYHDGTSDRHDVNKMSFEEYKAKSLQGWLSTARGLISLIRQNESRP
jgi:hypothetical protein